MSYGNIIDEVYMIIYDWIKPVDLVEVEGLCEQQQDVITFHKEIFTLDTSTSQTVNHPEAAGT